MDLVLTPARFVVAAALAALTAQACAAGNAAAGQDVFAEHCAECHSAKDGKHKKGPSLFATLGRPAASLPGFANYSAALKASGKTWTPDALDAYLTNPKTAVPGGTMKYDGLADAKARADLIAYLATLK
ncbi:c-type cytochrome [Roseateles cellulosilyticus]|uniref:C-type cytochrome n=1 Tax=Pelomonas cellulosilytica TaxID=2906762 RepID=A0ABS8Y1U3_9BURK|nr:c-type cytochrome [Pelomonas sp. P8]MCE4558217.1 c-type cytochrome [Pelomonas sp. P8]